MQKKKTWARLLVTADVGWLSHCPREGTLSSARAVHVTSGCVPARVVVNCQPHASHQQAAKFIKWWNRAHNCDPFPDPVASALWHPFVSSSFPHCRHLFGITRHHCLPKSLHNELTHTVRWKTIQAANLAMPRSTRGRDQRGRMCIFHR